MAHYAADCWDLEIHTSYGWIECVGHADRACYDLAVHAKATNCNMHAAERIEKKIVDAINVDAVKKVIGKTFKDKQKEVVAALESLAEDPEAVAAVEAALATQKTATVGGFEITADMVKFERCKKSVEEEKFLPSVIEPSFGIGRILYALLEHSFYQPPGDEQRVVMRFNAQVAPVKCNIYPLQSNSAFGPFVSRLNQTLTAAGLANKVLLFSF
jgi:glycyl-tRNA synthetase